MRFYIFTLPILLFVLGLLVLVKIISHNKISKQLSKASNSKIVKNYKINDKTMDYLLICEKGIVVVNVLDNKGTIFGNDFKKEYEVSYKDKVKKINSPTIESRKYMQGLHQALKTMGYNNVKVYQANIFANADIRNVKCNVVYKNGKAVVKSLKTLSKNLDKKKICELANSLERTRATNEKVVYQETEYLMGISPSKAYK